MEKMTQDIKEVLENNIVYFATASQENKPNVVPVGLVEPISDSQVLLVDVRFNKTRKNLEENPQVALAVTDVPRLQAYQLKGQAKVITEGEWFDRAFELMQKKGERRENALEGIKDPKLKDRIQHLMEMHHKLKPKAVVLIEIEEIYSTMGKV